MKKIFLIFIISNLWAQPDSWTFNPASYEHQMSVTTVVLNALVSGGDALGAFNEQGGCVGVSSTTLITFGPHIGQYAFLMQVYSNYFSGGETISFRFYDEETETVYNIENHVDFIQDGVLGNLASPLLFYIESNTAPYATGGSAVTILEDTSTTITLEAFDADGDFLTYSIVNPPSNGELTITGNTTTYIPNTNFNGDDSFQFLANDGEADSNIAEHLIIIVAVNDAPYLYPIEDQQTPYGELFVYNLQAQDVDGDALVYAVTFSGGSATANITDNTLTIVPQEPNVVLNVVVTVSDGNATHSTSFLLTVLEEGQDCSDNNADGLVDEFPVISVVDGNAQVLIQSSQDHYIDSGATCSDQEDGALWDQVEVSGDVVNLNVPGTYMLAYNCSDSDGNAAQTKHRTVFVIAQNGDLNTDTELNVVDVVNLVNLILGETE